MSKRKGVSLEEKRQRILQIFHEKKEFFNLKEIEKIASAEKGVVVQSVKDILQALVDDGLVFSDKIGSSIYFWAFLGGNTTSIAQRVAESNKVIVESEFRLDKLKEEIRKEETGKEDTEERRAILREVEDLREEVAALDKQIAKFTDSDPELVARVKEKAQLYKEAVNTWTDNIFAIQTWCKRKFDISEDNLNKQFNIPPDLDYVE